MLLDTYRFRWFRPWRKTKCDANLALIDFSVRLRVFHDDGWVSLELLLINGSDATIWVEHATVALSDLEAKWQTTDPAAQTKHKIRQNLGPHDTLRISLAGAIYDAAGRPQGPYSSIVHTFVHYRLLDKWLVAEVESCRIEMAALSVLNLLRPRWYHKKIKVIKSLVGLRADEH